MKIKANSRVLAIAAIMLIFSLAIATLSIIGYCLSHSKVWPQKIIWLRSRMIVWEFKFIRWIAGLKITIEGQAEITETPFLLLCNHVSYWDIVAICSLFPVSFIAKEEVRSWPILGRIAAMCQVIFVKRESAHSRGQALYQLAKNSRQLAYCVFPEGTTTAADAPTWDAWHRGNISLAIRPGLAIYTLGLHYRDQPLQAWIGDDSFFPHLYQALGRPQTEIFISLSRLPIKEADCQIGKLRDLSYRAYLQVLDHCSAAKAFQYS